MWIKYVRKINCSHFSIIKHIHVVKKTSKGPQRSKIVQFSEISVHSISDFNFLKGNTKVCISFHLKASYCLFICEVMSNSFCDTMDYSHSKLLCPWDFSGKSTGVGCHFLLQGIFLTQGSDLCLLHCRVKSLPLSLLGSPTWKPLIRD